MLPLACALAMISSLWKPGAPASTTRQEAPVRAASSAASIRTSSPLRGSREPTCRTNGASISQRARTADRAASRSPGLKASSTPLGTTRTRSVLMPHSSRMSYAVASETAISRVARPAERRTVVRNRRSCSEAFVPGKRSIARSWMVATVGTGLHHGSRLSGAHSTSARARASHAGRNALRHTIVPLTRVLTGWAPGTVRTGFEVLASRSTWSPIASSSRAIRSRYLGMPPHLPSSTLASIAMRIVRSRRGARWCAKLRLGCAATIASTTPGEGGHTILVSASSVATHGPIDGLRARRVSETGRFRLNSIATVDRQPASTFPG